MPAFIKETEKFEVQAYAKPENFDQKYHLPFSGSPQKHPYDPDRIILVADPFTPNTFYYEFKVGDIGFAEELPNMTNMEGEAVAMARIWVKKKSVGIRSTPFLVEDIRPRTAKVRAVVFAVAVHYIHCIVRPFF